MRAPVAAVALHPHSHANDTTGPAAPVAKETVTQLRPMAILCSPCCAVLRPDRCSCWAQAGSSATEPAAHPEARITSALTVSVLAGGVPIHVVDDCCCHNALGHAGTVERNSSVCFHAHVPRGRCCTGAVCVEWSWLDCSNMLTGRRQGQNTVAKGWTSRAAVISCRCQPHVAQ